MANMQDGSVPVGVSYEVFAADEKEAIENGWRAAEAAGRELGITLYVEQIEAGKWEVVMQDNGPTGSGIPPVPVKRLAVDTLRHQLVCPNHGIIATGDDAYIERMIEFHVKDGHVAAPVAR